MKRLLKWTVIVLGGLVGLSLLAGLALAPIGMKKLTRIFPGIQVQAIDIPAGPEAVAHGEHIALVWGCTKCHGEDLSGKLLTHDALLGTIPSSNLTSGSGGIAGTYTDVDWVRAIRHGVKPDGSVEVMMYNYSTMSDRDLGDLVAYLKQVPAVDSNHPAMSLGPLLPIAPAVGLMAPAAELIDHTAPRPADPAPGATIEYGQYLSALCTECHGSQLTGLAGKVKDWKQEDFIQTFQTGVYPDGKQLNKSMQGYSQMDEMELSALWLYLRSLQSISQ